MAKKSFRNSPAMQFITQPEEAETQQSPVVETEPEQAKKTATAKAGAGERAAKTASGKKTASVKAETPAKETEPQPPAPGQGTQEPEQPAETPQIHSAYQKQQDQEFDVPMKPNPAYIETRSRRVQLLMQPSLHKKLKAMAAENEISFNDLVHNLLEQAAE